MNRWVRFMTPVALAGLMVGAVAAPAHAQTVLDHGHVDVFDVTTSGSTLDVNVNAFADTGAAGTYNPANAIIEVSQSFTVPGGWDICATGTAWVLPQNPVAGLVWAGWHNHASVTVTVALAGSGIDNPSGGSTGFCIYTASGGSVTQMLLDDDGSPSSFTIAAGAHGHANWAFDDTGTYTVTVNVTGSGLTASGNHTYTFDVG
jgi:surface-anchored protein